MKKICTNNEQKKCIDRRRGHRAQGNLCNSKGHYEHLGPVMDHEDEGSQPKKGGVHQVHGRWKDPNVPN